MSLRNAGEVLHVHKTSKQTSIELRVSNKQSIDSPVLGHVLEACPEDQRGQLYTGTTGKGLVSLVEEVATLGYVGGVSR